MELLVAIDGQKRFEPALWMLKRLDFSKADWHFAHVVSPIDPSPQSSIHTGSDAKAILAEYLGDSPESKTLIDQISRELSGKVHLLQGAPVGSLMKLAESERADVVGLGTSGRSVIEAAFLGSVCRAFAVGYPSSFLIGRGNVARTGKVRVVFATDHSEYARGALRAFLAMKPAGIESVTLLTAFEMLEGSELVEYVELLDEATQEGRTLREHLAVLGEQSVEACGDAGIPATIEMREGFVSSAIDHVMTEQRADLLVLGAQGHGFMERLLIGSVALHQVAINKHSTLVIRTA